MWDHPTSQKTGSAESKFCYFAKYERRKVSSESEIVGDGGAVFVTAINNEEHQTYQVNWEVLHTVIFFCLNPDQDIQFL